MKEGVIYVKIQFYVPKLKVNKGIEVVLIGIKSLIYVSNRTCSNSFQEFWFDIQKNKLIQPDNVVLLAKRKLVVNFQNTDEKQLIARGIPTISAQTLISIAGGCSFRIEDLNFIFMRAVKVRYSEIFGEELKINCALIFHSNYFWSRIARIIQECIDLIGIQGLQDFLLLEIKVIPILHEMFDDPYPLDAERAKEA